ncbi:hypothetical protein H5410_000006 [Solanum commersonii]|uniref:Endonuclease/exonuclease/phosphatase domain-containing protein n=1 Tax=Solanum commersonii TaxID=4109 RepID=A0A9J6AVA5_SOLCO|nr:hypothetical protein H5410_000006 [Solanum commersonii]
MGKRKTLLQGATEIVISLIQRLKISPMYLSIVYAKSTIKGTFQMKQVKLEGPCKAPLEFQLQSTLQHFIITNLSFRLRSHATLGSFPWAVCGDFNTIITREEKKGGNPFNITDSTPFINCIDDCMLMDAGYSDNNFTWCNNHKKVSRKMWEILDRLLINNEWEELFKSTTVQHLARNGYGNMHCTFHYNKCDYQGQIILSLINHISSLKILCDEKFRSSDVPKCASLKLFKYDLVLHR